MYKIEISTVFFAISSIITHLGGMNMTKATKKAGAAAAIAKKVKPVVDSSIVMEAKTEETKKITAKPEAKKLTTAKEPKKITTTKEPVKIAAKPEPKKIVDKTIGAISATSESISSTEDNVVKKKTTTKKASKVSAASAEKETKTTKKVAEKEPKTTAKKTTKKAETTKKAASTKTSTKKVTKKVDPKKLEVYTGYSLDECISKLQQMGVHHVYEDYKRFLMDESDIKKIEKDIIDGNDLTKTSFTFDDNGFDVDLVMTTLEKVADTMDIKATDFKEIGKQMKACVKYVVSEDAEANASAYLNEFNLCEKVLMIGQRKGITLASEVQVLVDSDVDAFVAHFLDLAYAVLPFWQYDDVKFYEDFIFAVLSQYVDLYEKYQLRVLIDVADLYIKHGDQQHGDVCYGYILRDNQIKDYIYYRFASVYENVDMDKAKRLAHEALQFVDDRFMYFTNIIEIINK